MSFLRCNKVSIRAIEASDFDLLMTIENDFKEWSQSENYLPFSKDVLLKYTSGEHDLVKYGQYRFIIDDTTSGRSCGAIDIFDYNPIHSRAGVGIYLLKEFRNQGLASAALEHLVTYCKEKINLELLHASVVKSNGTSLKLFKSNGFKEVGEREGWTKINNRRENVVLFQRSL